MIYQQVDFAFLAKHGMKLKEIANTDKHVEIARQIKEKVWTMRVIEIPIIDGMIWMEPKVFEKSLVP